MNKSTLLKQSIISRWLGAFTGFYRPIPSEVLGLDTVSRFLYAARSVILVISFQAALIATLLSINNGEFHYLQALLVFLGFSIAHMISNLSNDYFGYLRGHDTPDSPRMRYTVHPLANGVLSPRALASGLVLLSIAGLLIAAYFIITLGWMAASFSIAGIVILFWYDAAPIPLKSIGLGELAVFLVWGPLMIGGGNAVISGHLSIIAFYIAIPYGLGVMSILIGKHIDQREFDRSKGIRTLPVVLGERNSRNLNILVIVLMYGITISLIGLNKLSPFVLVCLLALPKGIRAVLTLHKLAPTEPPVGYVGWPLWYHRVCLVHHRAFAWLYIIGLALAAFWSRLHG